MRYLLAFFFFVMYAGDSVGLNVGLAPGVSLKNLLLYMMIAGIALNAAVARNRRIELPSVLISFGLLILYAAITWIAVAFVLDSPDYDAKVTFIRLKSTIVDMYLTLIVFLFGVVHARDSIWLLRAMVWIVLIGSIITVVDTFNIPNLGLVDARPRDGRFQGFVGSANEYGSFLVLFLPALVVLYLTEKGKLRMLAAIGVFSAALALVLTGSRGAYVGLVAGTILAAFFLRNIISTKLLVRAGFIAISIFALVLSIALIVGYSDLFLERFARFGGSSHVATSGRSTIWANALAAMVENPLSFLTGFGFGSYESSRSHYAATHNMYLNYLYNLGSIGLLLFLTVFGRILTTARAVIAHATSEIRPYFVAMIFGLCAFLIAHFFGEYHGSGYLLWAYLGVVMRMAVQARSDAESEPLPDTGAGRLFNRDNVSA